MKTNKIILNFILKIVYLYTLIKPIKLNQIVFVSLEGKQLKDDFYLLNQYLKKDTSLIIKHVLFDYNKKNIKNNFLYLINCIKQTYYINTSKVVILNDNNYVVSNFKRSGVTVIQLWHASGAIKKFGNALKRTYEIKNYDYVVANGPYWIKPYSLAFNVASNQVILTGMPRLDLLYDKDYLNSRKEYIYQKYPLLGEKKIALYAPTFRGNIYTGIRQAPIDLNLVVSNLRDDELLVVKNHPLLKEYRLPSNVIDMSDENIYDLFAISSCLISDYSSIILDYYLLNKPIYVFLKDYDLYQNQVGYFLDPTLLPGEKIYHEKDLINLFEMRKTGFDLPIFSNFDGNNTKRLGEFIKNKIRPLEI